MHTFLLTLHVVAAVFLAGPLVVAPMAGLRALRGGDDRAVRDAARVTMLYGLLSLIIAGLGLLVVPTKPKEYTFGTPWVIISMTLYLVTLAVVMLAVVPALRSAGNLLAPVPAPAAPAPADAAPASASAARDDTLVDAAAAAPAADRPAPSLLVPPEDQDPSIRAKLDALRGRITATSGIVAVLLLIIVILMVTRPFGR